MKKALPLFFTCLTGLKVLAGSAGSALPMHYTVYAVSISIGQGSGSGFFVQASNSVYMVTARHVLFDTTDPNPANHHLWAPKAVCKTFLALSNDDTNPQPRVIELDLAALYAAHEVRFLTNHDIAVVRIEDCNPTNRALVSFDLGAIKITGPGLLPIVYPDACRKSPNVKVASECILFGYPSSIGLEEAPQIDPNLPLLRKGIIAGFNSSRNVFILDCPSYPGDSGGPVVLVDRQIDRTTFVLIGIVTEFVPFRDVWMSQRFHYGNQTLANSGYSVMEPIDVIDSLIWK